MGLMTYDGYASPRSTTAFVASETFSGHGAPERSLLDGTGWETERNYALFGVAAQPIHIRRKPISSLSDANINKR